MEKKKAYASIAIVLIIFIATIAFISSGKKSKKIEIRNVALIVYGNDASRWENLRQGAELACDEEGVELTLINMSEEGNTQEQIDLIDREIASGAEALLIAAYDSDKIGEYIDNSNIKIPVVFVENGVNTKNKTTCISANDLEMGRTLGKEIVNTENAIVKVAIISDENQRESVKLREKGLREIIEPYASNVVTWERNDSETNMLTRKFLQRAMLQEAVDVVVALDNDTTDALMDALENLNRKTKVYAISTSDKSVYYLDQKKIKALEYQTEFGIGYIGAKYALNKKDAEKQYGENDIKYSVVTKDNMYEEENQKLLFPFVQ